VLTSATTWSVAFDAGAVVPSLDLGALDLGAAAQGAAALGAAVDELGEPVGAAVLEAGPAAAAFGGPPASATAGCGDVGVGVDVGVPAAWGDCCATSGGREPNACAPTATNGPTRVSVPANTTSHTARGDRLWRGRYRLSD
jgi:hypothetical protein